MKHFQITKCALEPVCCHRNQTGSAPLRQRHVETVRNLGRDKPQKLSEPLRLQSVMLGLMLGFSSQEKKFKKKRRCKDFYQCTSAPQVRSCWTLWLTRGTSSSAMFCPCCRPSSTPSRCMLRYVQSFADGGFSVLTRVCARLQGKEPSVRQLALLHFRNIITLNLKLDEALSRPRARVPPSIIQMLMILQVHTRFFSLCVFSVFFTLEA